MSEKRRDNRKRILRNGESQRPDGRYVYKYYDAMKKQHFLYSWKLEPTDKLPAGKRDDLSLREKIRQLQKDMVDGIDVQGSEMTVLELVKRYLATKTGVKPTTEAGYKTVVNILEKEAFSRLPIKKIRHSDAKLFLIKLQKEDGRSYSSIHSIRGVLRPAFAMAMEDDYIRKNPFEFELVKSLSTIRSPGRLSPQTRCGSSWRLSRPTSTTPSITMPCMFCSILVCESLSL